MSDQEQTMWTPGSALGSADEGPLPFAAQCPPSVGLVPILDVSEEQGRLACGTLPWCQGEHWFLAVVVKACFDLTQDPPTLMTPAPLYPKEQLYRGNPMAHVVSPKDLIPLQTHAEVTLNAEAFAPSGPPVSQMHVGLRMTRDDSVLIDKSLAVVASSHETGGTLPDRLPLTYERAYGGLGVTANPVGCGAAGDRQTPNIVYEHAPETPAGFGALSEGWSPRKDCLGGAEKPRTIGGALHLPNNIDWAYFQSAPSDQQVEQLRGDELIELRGMRQNEPSQRITLPRPCVEGNLFGLDDKDPHPLEFHIKALHLDVSSQQMHVTFRTHLAIPSQGAVPGLSIVVGIALEDEIIALPEEAPEPPAAKAPPANLPPSSQHMAEFNTPVSPASSHDPEEGLAGATLGIHQSMPLSSAVPFEETGPPSSRAIPHSAPPVSTRGAVVAPPPLSTLPDSAAASPPPPSARPAPAAQEFASEIAALHGQTLAVGGNNDFAAQLRAFEQSSQEEAPSTHEPNDARDQAQQEALLLKEQQERLEQERQLALEQERQLALEQERQLALERENQKKQLKEAERRRKEEADRFYAEQREAQERESQKKQKAQEKRKNAGLDFRRSARRGFGRDESGESN